MLVLLAGDTSRLESVIWIIVVIALWAGALFLGFYILFSVADIVYTAFSNPSVLATRFLVTWAVLSALVWLLEGDRVAYGWAAAVGMVIGMVIAFAEA